MELSSQFPFPAMPCGCHATLLYFVHYKKSFSSNQVFSESFTLLPWSSLTFFFFFYFFFPCMYEGLLQLLLSFSAFYKIMRGSNNANGTCRNRRIQCFVGLVPPPLLRRGAAWWCDGDGSLCGIASDKRKRGKNGVSSFLKDVSSGFCTYILMAHKYWFSNRSLTIYCLFLQNIFQLSVEHRKTYSST